ncbi:MAG: EamA family transporter [Actinobacteria bacterium]|nr:EamA family transporter [Actinomycetota bacterium]
MIAAVGLGLAAALCWGVSSLCAAPASRLAGPWQAILWMSLITTMLAGAFAFAFDGVPKGPGSDWVLLTIAGLAFAASLVCWLGCLREGSISSVVPIVACDGAFAAVLAVALGESLSVLLLVGLGLMVASLALVVVEGGKATTESQYLDPGTGSRRKAVTLAAGAAVTYGIVFLAGGRAYGVDPLWAVVVVRAIPLALALAVCLYRRSFLPPRSAWIWILICGVVDGIGWTAYLLGARHSLAVAAVVSSQYAAVAVLGGVVVLGERLGRRELVGIAALVAAAGIVAGSGG